MNNFFSGHNMANEIMQKTSLPMQMDKYVNDHRLGVERTLENHPERLSSEIETKKPFLEPVKPCFTPPETFYPSKPQFEIETPSMHSTPAFALFKEQSTENILEEIENKQKASYQSLKKIEEDFENLRINCLQERQERERKERERINENMANLLNNLPKPVPHNSLNYLSDLTNNSSKLSDYNEPSTPQYTFSSSGYSGGSISPSEESSRPQLKNPFTVLDEMADTAKQNFGSWQNEVKQNYQNWKSEVKSNIQEVSDGVKGIVDAIDNISKKLFGQ